MAHTADEINHMQRYTMWSVFRPEAAAGPGAGEQALEQLQAVAADTGSAIRGWCRCGRFARRCRPDGVVARPRLRDPAARLPRAARVHPGQCVDRPHGRSRPCTESPSSTRPMCLAPGRRRKPRDNICVYLFVRSHEWYLLPDEDCAQLLADHGRAASGFADVRQHHGVVRWATTSGSCASRGRRDSPRIVDLMRVMRTTGTSLCAWRRSFYPDAAATSPRSSTAGAGRDVPVTNWMVLVNRRIETDPVSADRLARRWTLASATNWAVVRHDAAQVPT